MPKQKINHIERDALQSGLIVLGLDARVRYLNTAGQMLLNSTQNHAHGLPLTYWFGSDDNLRHLLAHIEQGSGDVYRGVLHLLRQGDGAALENALPVYVVLSPLASEYAQTDEEQYLLECF